MKGLNKIVPVKSYITSIPFLLEWFDHKTIRLNRSAAWTWPLI